MEPGAFSHTGKLHTVGNRHPAATTDTKSSKIAALLFFAYLVTKPFYLFPSGGPQIADGFVALLLVWALFSRAGMPAEIVGIFTACIYFTVYTFIVNCIWALVLGDVSMLKTPIFYAFNTILIFIVFEFYCVDRQAILRLLFFATLASLVVQSVLALSVVSLGTSGRDSLFFNNPNQLGYWALLTVSIFSVVTRGIRVRLIWQLLAFALGFFLISLSLGKAATLALGILFALHFSRSWWHFVLAALFGGALLFVLQDQPLMEELTARLANIGEQRDDSLAGRGYARIWHYPEHLLFGAGEFGLERFPGETLELHSTLGTILFSYGVIGFALFLLILLRLLKRSGWRNFLYLAPAFAYGLTHQGLRFSLFWILFAALALIGHRRDASGESSRLQPQPADPPTGTADGRIRRA